MNLTELQQKINNYITVVSSWVRNVGKLYFSSTPENVTVQLIDDNGNVVNSTLPNVAQFRKRVWDDIGGALGQFARTFYVDSINGDNANDGSVNNPFATLKKACDSVPIGGSGVIYIKSDISMTENIFFYGSKNIYFRKHDESNTDYKITCTHYENGDTYRLYRFVAVNGIIHIGSRKIEWETDDYTGDLADHSSNAIFSGSSDGCSSSIIFHSYNGVVRLRKASLIQSNKASLAKGGLCICSFYGTDIITNNNYVIDAFDTTVNLQAHSVSIDDSNYWINNIVRDADSGNPLNVISNINFSS